VLVRRWAQAGVEILRTHRNELNALNVFPVPDGDTGTNLYLTFRAACEAESGRTGDIGDPADALAAMARGALLGARGNSGVILAQTLKACADAAISAGEALTFAALLQAAATAARTAVAEPREGTALTVLDAAATVMAREPGAAADAARDTLSKTPDMLPILKQAGVVDAGGRGVVLLLDALDSVWHGTEMTSPPVGFVPDAVPAVGSCVADAHYELMFLVDAVSADDVESTIAHLGVSLAVSRGADAAQVHIHCDEPSEVIMAVAAISSPRYIRIEVLSAATAARRIVAAAYGSGIVQELADAGVAVVPMEPGRRPSVSEFVATAVKTGASEVVLLPGDRDNRRVVRIAAEELAVDGIRAEVVDALSAPQLVAAVSMTDVQADLAVVARSMKDAIAHVTTVAVSEATRDSDSEVGSISQGDFLAFVDDQMRVISRDPVEAVCAAALNIRSAEIITVITGADLLPSDSDDLVAALQEMFSAAEVTAIDGQQDVWLAIVGFE